MLFSNTANCILLHHRSSDLISIYVGQSTEKKLKQIQNTMMNLLKINYRYIYFITVNRFYLSLYFYFLYFIILKKSEFKNIVNIYSYIEYIFYIGNEQVKQNFFTRRNSKDLANILSSIYFISFKHDIKLKVN